MKKRFVLSALLFVPVLACAWGLEGHRIIGEIAQRNLTKKAQKQVMAVLGGCRGYGGQLGRLCEERPQLQGLQRLALQQFRGGARPRNI